MLETGQDSPTTLPDPSAATEPAPDPETRPRRLAPGAALAAGLLVFVIGGALVLRARGAVSDILLAQPTPTVTSAASAPTPLPSATAVPTSPVATLPPATIATGVAWSGGGAAISQDCQGTQALGASTFTVDNTHSTVAVDWWVNIANATPDGKQLWSSVNKPYGTLPPGQSVTVTVSPNPALCGQLAGHSTPVVYHLIISYGGVGGADLQDSITPPSGAPPPSH